VVDSMLMSLAGFGEESPGAVTVSGGAAGGVGGTTASGGNGATGGASSPRLGSPFDMPVSSSTTAGNNNSNNRSSGGLQNGTSSYNVGIPSAITTPKRSRVRGRGHTYSSSVSTDPEYTTTDGAAVLGIDEISSSYAAYHSHGSKGKKPNQMTSYNNQDDDDSNMYKGPKGLGLKAVGTGSGHKKKDSSGSLKTTARRAPRPPPLMSNSNIKTTDVHIALDNNDDAAPTPTIPAGPRRQYTQDGVASPMIPPTPKGKKDTTGPSRSNSVKSSRTLKKSKPAHKEKEKEQEAVRDQARQFVNATNNLRNGHPTAGSAAPSPTVGGKNAFPSPTTVTSQLQPQKEKTGFFRRVFGSSSSKDKQHSQREDSMSSGPERPKTQPGPAQSAASTQFRSATTGSTTRPPTQDPSAGSRGAQPDIGLHGTSSSLRKSTSSFFRRRKKSNADKDALDDEFIPPVPHLDLSQHGQYGILSLQKNSGEGPSLRNVMAPYLKLDATITDNAAMASPEDMFFDSREFSYGPNNDGNNSDGKFGVGGKSKKSGTGSKPPLVKAMSSGPGIGGERGFLTSALDRQGSAPVGSSHLYRDERQNHSTASSPVGGLFQSTTSINNGHLSASKSSFMDGEASSISELSMTLSFSGGTKASPVTESYPQPTVAPMPQRPAPTPMTDALANVRSALLMPGEKPLLSPISDRSGGLSENNMGTLSISGASSTEDFLRVKNSSSRGSDVSRSTTSNTKKGKSGGRVWLRPTDSEEHLAEKASTTGGELKPVPSGTSSIQSDKPALDRQPTTSSVNSANAKQRKEMGSRSNSYNKKHSTGADTPGTTATSDNEMFVSVGSLPVVQLDNWEMGLTPDGMEPKAPSSKPPPAPESNIPEEDRVRAKQIYDGDESVIAKNAAAAWLGHTAETNAITRTAYMECYNWQGFNVLASFRELCSRLILRAESQQLDRVIDSFSARWCQCNPHHGFKDQDVVHTLAFSILMLNTDLHLADMENRMTKNQFVKNTLPTIRSIADMAVDNAEKERLNAEKRQNSLDVNGGMPTSPTERPSLDLNSNFNKNRLSNSGLARVGTDAWVAPENSGSDGSNLLVNAPFEGTMKAWENQVEIILKAFYNSIRSDRLPLHGAVDDTPTNTLKSRQQSNTSLAVISNTLRRTPSGLSQAPSDNVSFRGRPGDMRSATARFASKSRTRPKIYPSSTLGSSSRTSLDDQSIWSPAASTFTKYSLGKTQGSFSVESLGSWGRGTGVPQAIGFANAINQAIIREEQGQVREGLHSSGDSIDFGRAVPMLEDDTLELEGPPWAKEGILKHKLHDKRSKDTRGWNECFAVIQKGEMRLFSFNSSGNSGSSGIKGSLFRNLRSKGKPGASTPSAADAGHIVGGGNWTENAHDVGSFTLRQTYATPVARDHSKTQQHIWALMLTTGAVHNFACGSTEGRDEWIATVNYWSARLSKEPLLGGVSNSEYGWGDHIISAVPPETPTSASGSTSFVDSATSAGPPGISHSRNGSRASRSGSMAQAVRPATSSSQRPPSSSLGRSSLDYAMGSAYHHTGRARLPGDKVTITEWRPPVSSMMASQLMEIDQRSALLAYVKEVEEELVKHNELRPLMAKAVSFLVGNHGIPNCLSSRHVIQMLARLSTTGIASALTCTQKSTSTERILRLSTVPARSKRRSMQKGLQRARRRKKM
jgi:hypothetical protein